MPLWDLQRILTASESNKRHSGWSKSTVPGVGTPVLQFLFLPLPSVISGRCAQPSRPEFSHLWDKVTSLRSERGSKAIMSVKVQWWIPSIDLMSGLATCPGAPGPDSPALASLHAFPLPSKCLLIYASGKFSGFFTLCLLCSWFRELNLSLCLPHGSR